MTSIQKSKLLVDARSWIINGDSAEIFFGAHSLIAAELSDSSNYAEGKDADGADFVIAREDILCVRRIRRPGKATVTSF